MPLATHEAVLPAQEQLDFDQFSDRYRKATPMQKSQFLLALGDQKARCNPYGWMMLQKPGGALIVVPYGPRSTFASIPGGPVNCNRGGQSFVVASLSAHDPVLLRRIAEMRQAEEPI